MLEIFDDPGPYDWRLVRAGGQDVAAVELSPIEQARYVGTYRGKSLEPEDAPEIIVRVWQQGGRLHYRAGESSERADTWLHLVPLGEHSFTPGRYRSDRLEAIAPLGRWRFVVENGRVTGFEVLVEDQVRVSAQRTQ